MKYHIQADLANLISASVMDILCRPFIAMLAWGAFLSMSHVNLPAFGFWEFFMLNCVCMILTSSRPTKWRIRPEATP